MHLKITDIFYGQHNNSHGMAVNCFYRHGDAHAGIKRHGQIALFQNQELSRT